MWKGGRWWWSRVTKVSSGGAPFAIPHKHATTRTLLPARGWERAAVADDEVRDFVRGEGQGPLALRGDGAVVSVWCAGKGVWCLVGRRLGIGVGVINVWYTHVQIHITHTKEAHSTK